MAGPIVIVPAHARLGEGFTKKEVLKSMEHPGRQTNSRKGYQTPAAWLDDLGALRKCIRAFVHEEEYAKLCIDPKIARRNARAAWGEKHSIDIIVK